VLVLSATVVQSVPAKEGEFEDVKYVVAFAKEPTVNPVSGGWRLLEIAVEPSEHLNQGVQSDLSSHEFAQDEKESLLGNSQEKIEELNEKRGKEKVQAHVDERGEKGKIVEKDKQREKKASKEKSKM